MRRAAAAALVLLVVGQVARAAGSGEKPGARRFDVSDRVEELVLPISAQPVTISLWTPLPPGVGVANLGDLAIYREAARRTGVTVRFVHPQPGREATDLASLVASASVPDMVNVDWSLVPGGPSRAITDELILPLNDVIATWMPDVRALFARNPARSRALRTDEGHYYGFPVLAWAVPDADALAIGADSGLQARGDMLEKLKIAAPRTLDDWDAALRLLKKEPGIETPLLLGLGDLARTHLFASARAASFGFFRMDAQVKYGPLEPGFRDFLALLAGWVKDGLVNPDLGTLDPSTAQARVVGGKAAAWIGDAVAMQRLSAALKRREPTATVVALAPPGLKAGEPALLAANGAWTGVIGNTSLALPARYARLKVTALWVDYWYSDGGRLLQHYGLPGETYRPGAGGRPELTAAGRLRRFNGGLTLFGLFDLDAWLARPPALLEAARLWAAAATADHALPPLSPAGREAAIAAKAAALVTEMTVRIATGAEPIERVDDYAKQLDALGIRELTAARQAQLDRTLRR